MIAALVPAAGLSSRMGRPKLLLEFAGQPLIGRVVSALRGGGAGRVVVVAPPVDTPEGPTIAALARGAGAEVVVPHERPAEMRDSIELGLEALARYHPPQSVLLTPADYPGLTTEVVANILQFVATCPERIVIPLYNGQRGHPIVLPWKIAVQVHSLPAGKGLNVLVAQNPQSITEMEFPNPDIVTDLDTPDDLERWNLEQKPFRVRVRLFALAKERAGLAEVEIALTLGSRVADLRAALGERLPALAPLLPSVLIAVDEEYAGDGAPIHPGSRLAVIPPVSGGSPRQ